MAGSHIEGELNIPPVGPDLLFNHFNEFKIESKLGKNGESREIQGTFHSHIAMEYYQALYNNYEKRDPSPQKFISKGGYEADLFGPDITNKAKMAKTHLKFQIKNGETRMEIKVRADNIETEKFDWMEVEFYSKEENGEPSEFLELLMDMSFVRKALGTYS